MPPGMGRDRLFAAALIGCCLARGGAEGADWRSVLERPLSPGTVALLLPHANEAAVQQRWTQALQDARPEVRAAASRVANVSAATSLVPALFDALEGETERWAALEEVRAIAALAGPAADSRLIAAARGNAGLAWPVALGLARARGAAARVHLEVLRAAGLDGAEVVEFFRLMGQTDPSSIGALGSAAIRDGDASAWAAVLWTAREAGLEPGTPILAASLTSSAPRLREATYWHLLLKPDEARPAAMTSALGASPEAMGEGGTLSSRFALELLRRRAGQPPDHGPEWVELLADASAPEGVPAEIRRGDILELLDVDEKAALRRSRGLKEGSPLELAWLGPGPGSESRVETRDPPPPSMRLAGDYPPGFVASLVTATGCRAPEAALAAGAVEYGRDGRPKAIQVLTPQAPCPELVKTLIMSAISPARAGAGNTVLLVIPLAPDVLTCLADAASESPSGPAGVDAARAGGRVEEPRKIHNVAPVYPDRARKARVQGTVVLETVLSTAGCVEQIRILQGVPLLDLAAFAAVSRWRYTPTLLDGRPVPVIMTVTVNFKLH